MLFLNKWTLMLIQHVKRQKILYEYDINQLQLSNHNDKEKVWQDIAKKLNMSVKLTKAKWKGLRDMYIKHLKSTLGRNIKYKAYKRWRWAKYVEFLQPHVERFAYGDDVIECIRNNDIKEEARSNGATDCNESVGDSTENILLEDLEVHVEETHDSNDKRIRLNSNSTEGFHREDGGFKTNKRLYSNENSKQKRHNMDYVQGETCFDYTSRDKVIQLDGLEHLFLGYAKTIKNLPMKNQINVKFKIAKLIMIEELKCLE